MFRKAICYAALALVTVGIASAHAAGIEDLRGKYTFDWLIDPEGSACVSVDEKLLTEFRSAEYTCNLNAVTNTASGHPAWVCTQVSDGSEYLFFETRAQCDEERETQASNE
jgi:hypothetical protein